MGLATPSRPRKQTGLPSAAWYSVPLSEGISGRGNTVGVDAGTCRATQVPHGGDQAAGEAGRHRYPALIGGMLCPETVVDCTRPVQVRPDPWSRR